MTTYYWQRIRERPRYRKHIIKHGLKPLIEPDGYWHNYAILPNGLIVWTGIELRKQMRKMIVEKYWPDITRKCFKTGYVDQIFHKLQVL